MYSFCVLDGSGGASKSVEVVPVERVCVDTECISGREVASPTPCWGVTCPVPKTELGRLPLDGDPAVESRGLSTRLEMRLSISARRSSADLPGGGVYHTR